MRLFLRSEIADICNKTLLLFELLIKLAEKNKDHLMPGYTHMQAAMPSSFGLWFSAWAESLTDDLILMQAAYRIINQNPLGSGAGYGSSLPVDRELTTELLGFDNLNINSVYAQMGRGKTEKIMAWGLSSIASSLSKMAGDICLYSGQNFGFFFVSEEFTTGSSIMPHKNNPDAWELIRGRCNKIQSLPAELSLVCTNLPTGYHRDYQLLKESLFPAIKNLKECLDMALMMLKNIRINEHIIHDELYDSLFSVEEVNTKVKSGMPFRQAYLEVATSIRNKKFKPNKQLKHTHTGSIGNLALDSLQIRMHDVVSGFNFKKAENAINLLMEASE
jgi:argininosuccinate lyase